MNFTERKHKINHCAKISEKGLAMKRKRNLHICCIASLFMIAGGFIFRLAGRKLPM